MSDPKEIVRTRNAQFEKLFNENKIDELVDTWYTPDAKFMNAGQPTIVEHAGIKTVFQKLREISDRVRLIEEEVIPFGNDAILDRGKVNVLKGEEIVDVGKYVVLHKQTNGKWQTYIDMFSSDRS